MIILLFWSALSTSTSDVRTPLGNYGGSPPPLPPPDQPLASWSPPPPVRTEAHLSDRFTADDKTMGTPARTVPYHLSADGASIKTPSRKLSARASSSVNRLSADDASLVPTISSDRFESEHVEPSDVELPYRAPSATTGSSRSRSDRGQKQIRNKAPPKAK